MNEAVICSPVRTAVGGFGGALRDIPAVDLASTVLRGLLAKSGLAPESVDDVVFGQCYPNGEAPAIGRVAALDAGFPVTVPGMQLDRRCGSSLQALCYAAMQVQTGVAELVIAGGAESMSQAEFYATSMRWGTRAESVQLWDRLVRSRVMGGGKEHPVPGGMIETAENLRAQYSITRGEQDALALRSHQRAVGAQRASIFAEEIVPVSIAGSGPFDQDEHPRADTSLEALAKLRPIRGRIDPESTVTAGNSSGQNDGAAACIVTTARRAAELGLEPMGTLRSWAVAGVAPEVMGIGPVPATSRALDRAGLTLADIDLIELNEAFAAQALAVLREWRLSPDDLDRVNVNGSGISLGHPVGATGVRIVTTLLHEMRRRDVQLGIATLCIGGGQGICAVFERRPTA